MSMFNFTMREYINLQGIQKATHAQVIPEFIVGFPEDPDLMIQTIHKIWGETAEDLRTNELLTKHLIKAESIKLA